VESLKRDVEALAAMERRSASEGERRSAEWLAGRLREAGAEGIRVQRFRYPHTFAHAQAAHFATGLAAIALRRRLLAAAALVSFELDYSGRSQWLRALLPALEGATVVGRLPARGERRQTVVLVAHHDAAHTGLMWNPALARAGDARAARTDRRESFALPVELALALAALGLRRLPAALLTTGLALSADVARGATVPGASDNATGVAAVLALVERLAAERPEGLEVIALLPGCEESGMGGMAAWLKQEGGGLDPSTTLVLGLDTLGAGEPVVLSGEGPIWEVRYRERDLALADTAAERAGLPRPRRFRIGGWTDPVLARLAGLPTLSLLSVSGGGFTNYHLPTDTPERVDWGSVERCLELADSIARLPG
jgi:acetylornithine deacetylase/succinyl-diaminopimelate desuccinylase-like protein